MIEMSGDGPGSSIVGDVFSGSVTMSETLRLTRQGTIAGDEIEMFYELYTLAFDHLKTLAFGRQVLTRAEFVAQMTDDRIWKYVAWTHDDEPVGLTTLTRALHTVPWISPDYFRANYPEQWSRNAVYYLGFTLAHPRLRHQRFVESLLRVALAELEKERAVVAFDVCAYDERVLRFGERIEEFLGTHPGATFETVDHQSYSRITFG